jgi:hypothetical protein
MWLRGQAPPLRLIRLGSALVGLTFTEFTQFFHSPQYCGGVLPTIQLSLEPYVSSRDEVSLDSPLLYQLSYLGINSFSPKEHNVWVVYHSLKTWQYYGPTESHFDLLRQKC